MNRNRLVGALAAALVLIVGISAADGELDLPAWTNIPGIDVPMIGDTDVLDCRLTNSSDLTVLLQLADGDSALYPAFEHVWWNGNLVDPDEVITLGIGLFQVEGRAGEQFYALSTVPDRDDRVFCESIELG